MLIVKISNELVQILSVAHLVFQLLVLLVVQLNLRNFLKQNIFAHVLVYAFEEDDKHLVTVVCDLVLQAQANP